MEKVIVTGGEGFVGTALVGELRKNGVEVTVIDRKSGGDAARDVPELLEHERYDAVFHLAAQTSVWNTDYDAILYDNVETFIIVCKACRKHFTRLIYASSSTANPNNTTSFYGMSKRMNEEIAQHYYPTATGVRLHNVYGKSQREGTLLWYLQVSKAVTLYNNGNNTRCFTYIDDAVKGLLWAYTQRSTLVNVAAPYSVTVKEFADEVRKYRPSLIICPTQQKKELDNNDQEVDTNLPTAPMEYKTIAEGIRMVFV